MNEGILDIFRAGLLSQDDIAGKRVLEVGSYDVNGSVRPIVEAQGSASYLGVDMATGPGVDRVMNCVDLVDSFGVGSFDIVITTEMLEHVPDWKACLANLAGVIVENGLLAVTTRSPGFPRHDYPGDYWRYTPEVLAALLEAIDFEVLDCFPDPDPASPGVIAKARKMTSHSILDTIDALNAGEFQPEAMDH